MARGQAREENSGTSFILSKRWAKKQRFLTQKQKEFCHHFILRCSNLLLYFPPMQNLFFRQIYFNQKHIRSLVPHGRMGNQRSDLHLQELKGHGSILCSLEQANVKERIESCNFSSFNDDPVQVYSQKTMLCIIQTLFNIRVSFFGPPLVWTISFGLSVGN